MMAGKLDYYIVDGNHFGCWSSEIRLKLASSFAKSFRSDCQNFPAGLEKLP
jgi:hypothetical protein